MLASYEPKTQKSNAAVGTEGCLHSKAFFKLQSSSAIVINIIYLVALGGLEQLT